MSSVNNTFSKIQGYVICGALVALIGGSAVGTYYNVKNGDPSMVAGNMLTQSYVQHGYIVPMSRTTPEQ